MELPDYVELSGFREVGTRWKWSGEPVGPAENGLGLRVSRAPGPA
jgi:hypothetical protein